MNRKEANRLGLETVQILDEVRHPRYHGVFRRADGHREETGP